jgi:MtaA/CmuA family methyltransferase
MTKSQKLDRLRAQGALPGETLFMPILMHFAARASGMTYAEFARDHRARVRANMECLERFDLDCVTLMSDPYAETSAFGAPIEYVPEGVPRCRRSIVTSPADVHDLPMPDVHASERTRDRLEGARLYRRELGDAVPVIGWVEGPLAEACDLAGMDAMFTMLMMDPDTSHVFLDKVLDFAEVFATAQIEAGCDLIGIGDAVCSQVDPGTYETFVKHRHHRLVDHIHARGGLVKFHVCGDITHLLPAVAELGVDLIDLDWPVDIAGARAVLGPEVVITGNLDPSLVLSRDRETVHRMAQDLVRAHAGTRYILAGGCEIGVDTPPANLLAMARAAREGD